MKAKKAFKRLERAEALLSSVLGKFAGTYPQIRGLVNSAKASIGSAKEVIVQPSSSAAKKRAAKRDENASLRHPTGPSQRLARATKKRRTVAKRRTGTKALAVHTVKTSEKRTVARRPAVQHDTAATPGNVKKDSFRNKSDHAARRSMFTEPAAAITVRANPDAGPIPTGPKAR